MAFQQACSRKSAGTMALIHAGGQGRGGAPVVYQSRAPALPHVHADRARLHTWTVEAGIEGAALTIYLEVAACNHTLVSASLNGVYARLRKPSTHPGLVRKSRLRVSIYSSHMHNHAHAHATNARACSASALPATRLSPPAAPRQRAALPSPRPASAPCAPSPPSASSPWP